MSIMEQLRQLRRPGQPTRAWVVRTFVVLTGTIGAIIALVIAGIVLRGDPGVGFSEKNPGTSLSVLLLAAAAALSLAVWWRRGGRRRDWFWPAAAAGFAFLAMDERFMWHERMDWWVHEQLGWDPTHPVTDKLDDVIVLGYGLVALGLLWSARRQWLSMPWFVYPAAGAGMLFGMMVLLDITDWGGMAAEEGAKLMAEALLISAVYGAMPGVGTAAWRPESFERTLRTVSSGGVPEPAGSAAE